MRRTRGTPNAATRRARLAIDTQLPSVRAIGTPKRDDGVASRKSQAAAIARPPPTAYPSTSATVGMGSDEMASMQASMRRS